MLHQNCDVYLRLSHAKMENPLHLACLVDIVCLCVIVLVILYVSDPQNCICAFGNRMKNTFLFSRRRVFCHFIHTTHVKFIQFYKMSTFCPVFRKIRQNPYYLVRKYLFWRWVLMDPKDCSESLPVVEVDPLGSSDPV